MGEEEEEAVAVEWAAAAGEEETMFPRDSRSHLAKTQWGAETGPRQS